MTGMSISPQPIASISSRTIWAAFWCTRPRGVWGGVRVPPPARRQPAPQPRAYLARQPRADDQLVRERLRVGRGLLLGGQEEIRLARQHGGTEPYRWTGTTRRLPCPCAYGSPTP